MLNTFKKLTSLTALCLLPAAALAVELGAQAPDFELRDEAGKIHKLSDLRGKLVVLEWTNPGCPFVKRHYEAGTMEKTSRALAEAAKAKGKEVVWLAVDSSKTVEPAQSAAWKKKHGFGFPVLQDPSGRVGRRYEAKTTPHMYVIDEAGVLRYRGAIDDDPRGRKGGDAENHVTVAVTDLLEGREVTRAGTRPYGCTVKYAREG